MNYVGNNKQWQPLINRGYCAAREIKATYPVIALKVEIAGIIVKNRIEKSLHNRKIQLETHQNSIKKYYVYNVFANYNEKALSEMLLIKRCQTPDTIKVN